MKKILLLVFAALLNFSSYSREKEEINNKKNNEKSCQPQSNIIVNKEYDDNGNLIRYDSTYSYYYSSTEEDTVLRDSIFNDFKNYFNNQYLFSGKPFFEDFFFEDSLLFYDFYKDDFFLKRYQFNMEKMYELFWEMDSIKNDFFMDQLKMFAPNE